MIETASSEEKRPYFAWGSGLGALVAAGIAVWLAGFATGFLPWLGYHSFSFHALEARSGKILDPISPAGTETETNFGLPAMLLFAGQTAYIDYAVGGGTGEKIFVDIAPWPAVKFSKYVRYVAAGQSGRLEVPIASTGVYRFRATVSVSSYRRTLDFTASWGARR